jgi:DNA-binding response OmpR family regulator
VAPIHVLHIEPDEATATFMRKALEESGHRLTHAATAIEGCRPPRERRTSLLELDLPDLDGLETIRRIRAIRKRHPAWWWS